MTPSISNLQGRRPFFWIGNRPGDGDLGPDQSVVPLGIWPVLFHIPDIERLSEHFVKEIQAIQPEGPYFLGGDCYNGFVAFEVARKFVASGQEVLLLVMVKPCHPSEYTLHRLIVRRLLLSIFHPTTIIPYVSEKFGRLAKFCRLACRSGRFPTSQPGHSNRPEHSKAERIALLFPLMAEYAFKSVENYVPKPYPGRLTFFVIDRMPLRFLLRSVWGKFARGGIDIYVERADTWDDLTVSKTLSAKIGKCIDQIVYSRSYSEEIASK